VFLLGLGLATARVAPLHQVGALRVDAPWVMVDFRHVVYYPSRAFWDGLNPYDAQAYLERYPVDIPVSLYAPATFVVFAPFGLLPLNVSSVAYFALTVLLTLVLGWAVLRMSGAQAAGSSVLAAGGVLLLSRPGHWNLLSGQITLIVVLATYAALSLARMPHLGGLGLAIALLKPSFGVPLIPVLLARGAWRTVAWGLGIAAALNVPVLLVLVWRQGGLDAFLTTVAQSVRAFESNPDTHPIHSVWRVDLVATISRLANHPLGASAAVLASAVVLAPVMVVSRGLAGFVGPHRKWIPEGLVCCAVLLSLFHQAYDLLLLALPVTGLVVAMSQTRPPRATQVAQVLLFLVLGLNYLATESALSALRPSPGARLAVVSANGLVLVALFALYLHQTIAPRRAGS
jgi:Glycosyltransferase family 87